MSIRRNFKKIFRLYALGAMYLFNRYIRKISILKPPIFIVGCGHSGTSLLLRLIGAHSSVCAIPGETSIAYLDNPAPRLKRFEMRAIAEGKTRWVEKTPKHIHRIPRLLELFPTAKIILVLRDGRDVAASIKNRTGSSESGIGRWLRDNRAGMKFWNCDSVLVVKYEDLVTDVSATLSSIFRFIGEDYQEEVLSYHKSPCNFYSNSTAKPISKFMENHQQHRNWQINQPIFDGRGKWRELTEEELEYINSQAGELLSEFGYV